MPDATRIEAGKMRHRIIITKPTLALDSSSGWQPDEQNTVATVYASIEELTGRDLYIAQQKVSEVTHRVRMRYRQGIKSNMNVNFENRFFEIQSVSDPELRHRVLELLCIERNDSARQTAGTAK